jgi:hypothetical protein
VVLWIHHLIGVHISAIDALEGLVQVTTCMLTIVGTKSLNPSADLLGRKRKGISHLPSCLLQIFISSSDHGDAEFHPPYDAIDPEMNCAGRVRIITLI